MYRISLLAPLACFLLPLVAGCERGPAGASAAKPLVVPVSRPVQRLVTDYVDYTGRTNAKNSVTIQPRVTGYLVRMPFKEGADVKKDDILFEIDPRPYQAQLKAAKAAVAQNEANLRYQHATNERFKELAKRDKSAVSARELDQYQALEEQAVANLDLAKANLVSAELNLEWTVVKSPINGHISRYYLTYGNLVTQDTTQLTTLVSMDPMYVYFDMDEPTHERVKKAVGEGRVNVTKEAEGWPALTSSALGLLGSPFGLGSWLSGSALASGPRSGDMKVLMGLPGQDTYPYVGTINFLDNQVNPGTGSISVRGSFKNPRLPGGAYAFLPGMFVRVRLPIGQPQPQLLVIDRAVASDQGQKKLYVVGADDKVEERSVTLGTLQEDGLRVIQYGLKKDDRVLIGALQQVRPRMTIQPEEVTMPTSDTPATPQTDRSKLGKGKGGKRKRP
jgi:multidrug efflux system membrane fusion protein